MIKDKNYYYQVDLTVALKTSDSIFGYINISHIPYSKFEELFKDQVTNERFLFDNSISYFIDEILYNKHKSYLDDAIPFKFDFNLFEYSVGLGSIEIQKYKKDYYEELPPIW